MLKIQYVIGHYAQEVLNSSDIHRLFGSQAHNQGGHEPSTGFVSYPKNLEEVALHLCTALKQSGKMKVPLRKFYIAFNENPPDSLREKVEQELSKIMGKRVFSFLPQKSSTDYSRDWKNATDYTVELTVVT